MGIGTILQNLIQSKGTNVNAVSYATGVNPQTIYSIIKRDSTKADICDLYQIAHHLGVDLNYFYKGYDISISNTESFPSSIQHDGDSAIKQRLIKNLDAMNEFGHEKLLEYSELLLKDDQFLVCDSTGVDTA